MGENTPVSKKSVFERIKHMGPSAIVSAALIGPGTITTTGLSGNNYGFALVWAVFFSCIVMVITQRMTAKIGLVGQIGLAAAIRKAYKESPLWWPLAILLILAFFVGNCAYQASNVVGAATGAAVIFGEHRLIFCILISAAALALVLSGSIKYIGNVLTIIVVAMVVMFLATAVVVKPDLGAIIHGMFIPSIPSGAQLLVIALIGTTMTPYCIYLHSDSHAGERIESPDMDVEDALIDNHYASAINAIMMFLVSTSIMVVGHAMAQAGGTISAPTDLANGLKPLAGTASQYIFAVGIFCAGISSAACAPLAATYIISGVMGWSTDLKDKRFRVITTIVFLIGCLFAIFGGTPTTIITTAQAIGGVALPISIILVILIANRSDIIKGHVNSKFLNILSVIVFIVTLVMSYRTFAVYGKQIIEWFA